MNQTRILFAMMLLFAASGFAIYSTQTHQPTKAVSTPGTFELAQDVPEDTIRDQPQLFPALLAKTPGDSTSVPLALKTLKMDVKTVGNMAQTTMELAFYNDMERELEGEFFFPLGEGQTISGYALEVEGVMRQGVVVEKAEGRKVFESVTRRRIDPGLIEWTKGNNFRTRIYPIPAKGTKRIRVTVDQELLSATNAYQYVMPMMFREKIDRFSVKLEVVKQNVQPVMEQGPGHIQFKNWKDSWTASMDTTAYLANVPLRFSIPKMPDMKKLFVEGAGTLKNQSYFYYSFDPPKQNMAKKLPSNVCLLWDASGSGLNRDIHKEMEVLQNYFKQVDNLRLQLVTFNNTVSEKKEFNITGGDISELKNHLNTVPFDGGTQLGALNLPQYSCDEFILCSDGISSFGLSDMKTSGTPVIALSSSQQADHSMLNLLARSTGGQYINTQKLSMDEIAQLMTHAPFRFIKARTVSGKTTEIYPSIPMDIHNTFSVSGILEGNQAEIELSFGYGSSVTYTQKIVVTKESNAGTNLVEHLWAQKKVAELDLQPEKNKMAITATGKRHGIVTRYTSLLVLDRIEDYVTHRIVPAEEDLRNDYYALLKETEAMEREEGVSDTQTKKQHMEMVVAAFNERIAWWNKDFKPYTLKKPTKQKEREVDESTMEEATEEVAAADTTAAVVNGAAMTHNLSAGYTYSFSVTDANGCTTQKSDEKENRAAEIEIKEFDPNTPYLKELKKAAPGEYYAVYLNQRKKYALSPTFFLDVSDFFFKKGDPKKGITILSNLAELHPENHQVLRVMAHRLQQASQLDLAITTFKEVLKIREEEPQSYRDLGLAYAEAKKFQEAADMLCKVVNRQWDGRFPEVEVMVAGEINALIAQCPYKLKLDSLDKRLIKAMPVDVRVVINWDNDNCDMDLWVTDPLEEVCKYDHNLTLAGGRISRDFTGGYGPEEFMVKKALNGKYLVQVNYYGSRQLTVTGPTTVQAEIYTNYGRSGQKKKHITLRLEENKEVIDIGELMFAAK